MKILRLAAALLLPLSLLFSRPTPAVAAADEAIAKMIQLNKEAVAAYQAGKYEEMRATLKQALDLASSSGLNTHPITARTHIHQGILLIGGLKQRDAGVEEFRRALEIEPHINLTKALITPELSAAFAEAKNPPPTKTAAAGASPGSNAPPPGPVAPPPPPAAAAAPPTPAAAGTNPAPAPAASTEASNALSHEPIGEAPQGSAISVTVGVESNVAFDKIVLAYRPDGASDFFGRQMKPLGNGKFGAEIPPNATLGSTVAYYLEAQDKDGSPVASRGSIDNPFVIRLIGVGAPRSARKEEPEEEEEGPDHRFHVALLVGSGIGWATGRVDTNTQYSVSPAGFAQGGPVEVSPELGYRLSGALMLSLQLRYQVITGTTDIHCAALSPEGGCAADPQRVFHTANYALAAFAKATWRFGEGKLHPFVSLAVGGGRIRHVVSLGNQHATFCGTSGAQTCVDTVAAGPVLAGPGGGLLYEVADRIALVLQANTVLGFPDFTANLDGNLGVAFGF